MTRSYALRALFTTLVALLAFSGPSHADQPGNSEMRRLIERNTVVIEIFNPAAKQRLSIGTGFVLGESDDTMTFGTAEHVLKTYRTRVQDGANLQIRAWQDSPDQWFGLQPTDRIVHADHGPVDFAVLQASSSKARQYLNPAPGDLLLAPVPNRDSEPVFYFGWDSQNQRLSWGPRGWMRRAGEASLEFDSIGLEEGRSGAMLCSVAGPFAIVKSRGGRGQPNVGIPLKLAKALAIGTGLPVSLPESKAGEALRYAADQRLLIGIHGTEVLIDNPAPHPLWYALEIEDQDDESFTGTMHAGANALAVRLRATPTGFDLILPDVLEWSDTSPTWRAALPAGTYEFSVSNDQPIDGMISFSAHSTHAVSERSSEQAIVELNAALPVSRLELLGARLLLSNKRTFSIRDDKRLALTTFFVKRKHQIDTNLVGTRPAQYYLMPLPKKDEQSFSLVIPGRLHLDTFVDLEFQAQMPYYSKLKFADKIEVAQEFAIALREPAGPTISSTKLDYDAPSQVLSWKQSSEMTTLEFSVLTKEKVPSDFPVFLSNAVLRYR